MESMLKKFTEEEIGSFCKFLDALRQSGVTNMLGAGEYLQRAFKISKIDAKVVLGYWMRNFRG